MAERSDAKKAAQRRARLLAAAGLTVLIGLPIFGPSRQAQVHREMAMVLAGPSPLAIDAARRLGELEAREGLPLIMQRLERSPSSLFDFMTASSAGLDTLGRIAAPEAVPFLVRVLEEGLAVHIDGEREQIQTQFRELHRRGALKALGPIRDPRAEPFLIEALYSEKDLFTMRYAALSLAQIRTARGRRALTRYAASDTNDSDRRLITIQGLAWCSGDDWNHDDLLDLLESIEDGWLQDRAVSSVAPLIPPRALERFRVLAEPRPPGMREASLVGAGDVVERRLAIRAGDDVIQRAMLAMSFAFPYVDGEPAERMRKRFCTLAPDRSVRNAVGKPAVIRREIRISALVAELC